MSSSWSYFSLLFDHRKVLTRFLSYQLVSQVLIVIVSPFQSLSLAMTLADACEHILLPLLQEINWLHLSVHKSISEQEFLVSRISKGNLSVCGTIWMSLTFLRIFQSRIILVKQLIPPVSSLWISFLSPTLPS